MLLEWIVEHVINDKGKINPRSSARSWWDSKGEVVLYGQLHKLTNFLPDDAKYAERIYCVVNNITSIPKCKNCGVADVKYHPVKKGYAEYCSNRCQSSSSETKKKRDDTNIQRYGYKKNLSSKQHRAVVNDTVTKKYGVDNYAKTPEFSEQSKKSQIQKYGDLFVRTDEYKSKRSKTCREKYGVEHWMLLPEYKEQTERINFKATPEILEEIKSLYLSGMPKQQVAEEVNFSLSHLNKLMKSIGLDTDLPQNKINYSNNFVSEGELKLRDMIDNQSSLVYNDRKLISPYELDIVDYDNKIAYEYNGTYWHSDFFKHRLDHLKKLELVEERGFKLFTIFENIFKTKPDIVYRKLNSAHPLSIIYARNTTIEQCKYSEIETFIEDNHIQGTRKSKYNYKVMYQGNIVAAATFNKYKDGVELIRFASNVRIPGILSKILKFTGFDIVYSFANRCYTSTNHNVYLASNFKEVKKTSPNYFYVKGDKTITRNSAQKHKLKSLLGVDYNNDLSEYENMKLAGYHRVWDCGNVLYLWRKE